MIAILVGMNTAPTANIVKIITVNDSHLLLHLCIDGNVPTPSASVEDGSFLLKHALSLALSHSEILQFKLPGTISL